MESEMDFMKRIIAMLMALMLCVAGAALAESVDLEIIWDGQQVEAACVVVDGRVYVAADELAAALGGEYEYTAEAGALSVSFGADADIVGMWLLGDAEGTYMQFKEDGTGVSGGAAASIATIIFEWSRKGDTVTLEYAINGMPAFAEYSYSAADGTLTYAGDAGRVLRRAEISAAPDVTGEWKCQLADALSTLTINADGTAKLVIGAAGYSLTWTLEGDSLNLDQNGVVITASYDGEIIDLPIAGASMIFIR